jgi:excisionase family DNA binding protein
MNDANKKKLLTVNELAQMLNLAPITIYKLIERRELPVLKVGRVYRFDPDEVFSFARVNLDKDSLREVEGEEGDDEDPPA